MESTGVFYTVRVRVGIFTQERKCLFLFQALPAEVTHNGRHLDFEKISMQRCLQAIAEAMGLSGDSIRLTEPVEVCRYTGQVPRWGWGDATVELLPSVL